MSSTSRPRFFRRTGIGFSVSWSTGRSQYEAAVRQTLSDDAALLEFVQSLFGELVSELNTPTGGTANPAIDSVSYGVDCQDAFVLLCAIQFIGHQLVSRVINSFLHRAVGKPYPKQMLVTSSSHATSFCRLLTEYPAIQNDRAPSKTPASASAR